MVRTMRSYRVWRDIPICGWVVFFWYHPREILCPTHGRVQEDIPWADPYARVTYRFEYVQQYFSLNLIYRFSFIKCEIQDMVI